MTSIEEPRITQIREPETGTIIDVSDLSPEEALYAAFIVSTPQDERYDGGEPDACLMPWFVRAQLNDHKNDYGEAAIDEVARVSGVDYWSIRSIYGGVSATENDVAYGLAVAACNLDIPLERAQELVRQYDGDLKLEKEKYVDHSSFLEEEGED